MVSLSFIFKPLTGKLAELISATLIEKWKIKWKLKQIKTFQKDYEDTFVDSNTFQQFLNDEKNGLLIFNYVFGATNNSITKVAFVEQLSKLAVDEINHYRKSVQLKEIDSHPIVDQYLYDLITYLEEYRDKSFKSNEMSILANIQNSIVKSNESLKKYFERNFLQIQERSYLERYTDKHLTKILDQNILDLGKRYISKANVETDFSAIFNSLICDEQIFQQFSELLGKLETSIMAFNEIFDTHREELEYVDIKFIEKVLNYFKEVDGNNKEFYLNSSLNRLSEEINCFMENIDSVRYKLYEMDRNNTIKHLINLIQAINTDKRELVDYIDLVKPVLINEPYLLIYGDAGIGKSHLLADNAKKLQEEGHSVFCF
ncbi:hypothetical protein [Bacillus sp. P14.5]|uniref:hypothetical protein n=1 Tax=Bacillus sp. P14.5 TaxID=1983400 RepID=UPI0031F588D0